jgi:hypothetical protein
MPGSLTTPRNHRARDTARGPVAFRSTHSVGFSGRISFVAQWLAYALPCRRFAPALTDGNARLGADVGRYSFIAVDLHHLLLAGLPAHAQRKRRRTATRCSLNDDLADHAVIGVGLAVAAGNAAALTGCWRMRRDLANASARASRPASQSEEFHFCSREAFSARDPETPRAITSGGCQANTPLLGTPQCTDTLKTLLVTLPRTRNQ